MHLKASGSGKAGGIWWSAHGHGGGVKDTHRQPLMLLKKTLYRAGLIRTFNTQ